MSKMDLFLNLSPLNITVLGKVYLSINIKSFTLSVFSFVYFLQT